MRCEPASPPAPARHCNRDDRRPQAFLPASCRRSSRTCQKPCTYLAYPRRLGDGERLEHRQGQFLPSPRRRLRKLVVRTTAESGLSGHCGRVVDAGRDAGLTEPLGHSVAVHDPDREEVEDARTLLPLLEQAKLPVERRPVLPGACLPL